MAVPVVIDGYNLLYARGEAPSAEGRERLVRDVVRWALARERRAVIVFDGWAGGRREETEAARGPVTVCFTRYGERADEWIERRVTGRSEVLVVTADRAVRQAVRRRGAAVLDSAAFAARIAAALAADEPGAQDREGPEAGHPARDEATGPDRGRLRGRQASWLRGL